MALAAIGLGLSVIGGLSGSRSARRAARQEASAKAAMGRFEAAKFRAAAKRLQSRQLTAFAKGGVQLEGTPTEVLASTAAEQELEALGIAAGVSSSVAATLERGRMQSQTQLLQTTGTLLTGLSQLQ